MRVAQQYDPDFVSLFGRMDLLHSQANQARYACWTGDTSSSVNGTYTNTFFNFSSERDLMTCELLKWGFGRFVRKCHLRKEALYFCFRRLRCNSPFAQRRTFPYGAIGCLFRRCVLFWKDSLRQTRRRIFGGLFCQVLGLLQLRYAVCTDFCTRAGNGLPPLHLREGTPTISWEYYRVDARYPGGHEFYLRQLKEFKTLCRLVSNSRFFL